MSQISTPSVTRPQSEAKLPFTSLIGYGAGDFANNLGFSTAGYFLMYYLTDSVGISAMAAGTLFLVVRIWDAFSDLFAGTVVDRTSSRWGKFRPFMVFAGIPMLAAGALQFNIGLVPGPKLLYAYVAYTLFGLLYSLVNIPYGSMAAAMTRSVSQRAWLVSARSLGTGLATVIITYVLSPWIDKVGAKESALGPEAYKAALQSVFTWSSVAFVVIGAVAYFLTFTFCRETVARTNTRLTFREQWDAVKGNKALGMLMVTSLFYLTGMFATMGSMSYYTKSIMGGIAAMATLTLVTTILQFIYTPFIPKMVEKWGKKNLYQFSGLFTIVGAIILFLAPRPSYWIPFIGFQIIWIGQNVINTVMFGLAADTIDYGEWVSGTRSEGATYAAYSFLRKISSAIGGWIGGLILTWGGYLSATATNPHPVQPTSALNAIVANQSLVPALCAVLAMLTFIKYPLTDAKYKEISAENEARKAALLAESGQDAEA